MADDEDEELCPLCMESLDITDQAATLCPCGYTMCLWCWHRIMEDAAKDDVPGKCPNCREPYDKERIQNATVDPDKIASENQKKKDEKKKTKVVVDKKALANVRVIQRNLVYVVGLSMSLCREEALRKQDYFGQFGKIVKISVNRNSPYSNMGTKQGPTGSAYVTYVRPQDALKCIENVDGATWDGRSIRACFGTTKYCNSFLKSLQCTNPDCLYLHEITEDNDCFTKEQMLARYGNAKNSPFFDLTHPMGAKSPDDREKHHADLYGMDVHESEMQEQHMRAKPLNLPPGAHMGGNYPMRQPSPPAGPSGGLGGPPPGFGSGAGYLGPGGSGLGTLGFGPGGAGDRMMGPGSLLGGPQRGPSPGRGGTGPQGGPPGYHDGPSWGQVAASGKMPPPPPPQPAAAVEEWPVLGGPPASRTSSGSVPGGSMSRTSSGKAKGAVADANGKSGAELIDSLGGIMVGKPPAGRGKAAPGSQQARSPGMGPPGPAGSSPFLSAAGSQAPPPQPKPVSGMVTMSIPNPQGAVSSSLRPGTHTPTKPSPVSNKVKGPPPGFGVSGSTSSPPAGGAAASRRPPPGFENTSSSNPGSAYSSMGASGSKAAGGGSLDNDQISALVDSLKAGLEPHSQDRSNVPSSASPGQGDPLVGVLQGLQQSSDQGEGNRTGSVLQPGAGAIPNLPAGLDVWSADVPPAFAGLATAGYNPLGYSAPAADPSARLLLRNAPPSGSGATPVPFSQPGFQASAASQGQGDPSMPDISGRRARSRFQFAHAEQDSTAATADPLWEGASGQTLPGAADVFQIFQQGSSASLKGAPPGFGGPQRPAGSSMAPGMVLLQRLQMGGGADMASSMGQGAGSAQQTFLDPAIIASHTTPGLLTSTQSAATSRAPPPGFGGLAPSPPPGFATPQGDAASSSSLYSGQQPKPSQQLDTTEYSSWEAR